MALGSIAGPGEKWIEPRKRVQVKRRSRVLKETSGVVGNSISAGR